MTNSNPELIVVGRMWVEYVAHVESLPKPGDRLESARFEEGIGGRGARQAAAASRLEVPVGLVSAVGEDARADSLRRWLADEHVDARHVRRERAISSGASLVHLDKRRARQTIVFPPADAAISPLDVEVAAEGIRSARALLVSLEVPPDAAARAIGLARLSGVRTVLDAAGAVRVLDEALGAVDVIHATPREAAVLTGVDVAGPRTADIASRILLERGPGAVLLEAGADGHWVATERGSRMVPRLGLSDADEEIADEAFVAALAAGLAEGRSLEDACTIAGAARALVGAVTGVAAFPRRDAVLRLLELTTGRSWQIGEAA